jgi:hypothetical protein
VLQGFRKPQAFLAELWHSIRMRVFSKAIRCFAVSLVLFVAVEVLHCDLFAEANCSQSQSQHQQQAPNVPDNCICCCVYAEPIRQISFIPEQHIVWAHPQEQTERPVLTPSYIDHPPQLT